MQFYMLAGKEVFDPVEVNSHCLGNYADGELVVRVCTR
jgi:hypothetical protein